MGDRVLEVIAHPRADDRRVRVIPSDDRSHLGQPIECRPGWPVDWRDRHHARELQPIGRGDGVGKTGYGIWWRTAADIEVVIVYQRAYSAVAAEIHLNQAADVAAGDPSCARERRYQLGAVDGVDDVGITRDRFALVRLQLADEVPHE